MKKFSFLLIVPIVLTSCFNKKIWDYEADYKGRDKNIYMTGVKTAPANNYYLDPIMRISRIEPVGDSVRLYTHLIDGDGMFLSGTTSPAHINNWCSVVVNDQPIREYTVREVSDYDRSPTVYALVLDHSGSMGVRTKKMQDAVRAFINKKRPQDAICIVKYDTKANLEVPINTNAAALQAMFASNGLNGYGGGTAILNGMMRGAEAIASSPYRRKVVISFTDGGDNSSTVTKEYVTWFAQQNNINLCTIDFNNSNYNNFMQELANQTSGTYTYFTNANQFDMVFSDVVNKMNHSYVVTYKAQPNVSQQTVALRYCAEPQALEATSGFNTSRPVVQPVRDAPRPINNNNNSASAGGDRPVYYRPNTPIQAPANNTGTNTVRPSPPRTIPSNGNSSGIRQPNGTTSPINNQIESGPTKPAPSNGNTVSPTKPSPANGNSGVGSGTSKPDASNGNSSSEGSPIKPPPSNGGSNSGGNTSSPTKPAPSNGNTVSPTKPSPANGNSGVSGSTSKPEAEISNSSSEGSPIKPPPSNGGNNSNGNTVSPTKPSPANGNKGVSSGTSKPDSSNGNSSSEGSPIKPPPSNNGGSNSGGNTKPVTKPSTTKPTTKPSGIKGSTKTPTVKPGTTGSSTGSGRDSNSNTTPTKPGYTRTPKNN